MKAGEVTPGLESDEGLEDDGDEGPILLPEGAACRTCHYVTAQQAPGPSIIAGQPGAPQVTYFCRRGPPSAVLIPAQGPNGPTMVMASQPPPVAPDYACFEYDAALPALFVGSGQG